MSVDEFKQGVKNACVGKKFEDFPNAFKSFIANQFKTIDVNGMFEETSQQSKFKLLEAFRFISRYIFFSIFGDYKIF